MNRNICFIAYAEYYNDARIKSYITILIKNGFKVDLYCPRDKFSKSDDNLRIFFTGIKYQGDSKLLYFINYLRFCLLCFLKVNLHYIKERYKVFHVHNQPDFLIFIPIIPKLFNSKLLLDLHDIMIAGAMSKFGVVENNLIFKLTKFQTKVSVKFSDSLIFSDHSQRDYLKNNGIEHPDTNVFLNLPSESFFSKADIKYSNNSSTKLVFHGTLTERLGLDIVIKATEKVNQKMHADFTLIGGGNSKNDLIEYCKSKGILNQLIFFKPFIPVEELQKEIIKYNIGVIGNKKSVIAEKCMLPVKLMEYLYIGIPVIAPRFEVIKRYFSEDMVEFYEPENIEELSDKIIKLASNPERRKDLVKNSAKFFEQYNWTIQKKEYLGLINKLHN